MICKNPKHDLMAIPDILCTIREELYALLKKQYQYDKDFSKYVENELCKIRGTLTANSTDINERIKQLEENIKNGSLIPTISKPKINTLF